MKVKNDHRGKFSNLSSWKEAWKKIRTSTGFEPVTFAIPVRCSTNWAMKPHIGSEVNQLRSYLPVERKIWKFYFDYRSSLSSTTASQIWIISYNITLHIISFLTGRHELNWLTSLSIFGFMAQLVEHRTAIAEVTGLSPVEAMIFVRFLPCLSWKIYRDDHSSL